MPQLEFDLNFPNDLRLKTESILAQTKWICPLWLQRIFIGWDDANTSDTANVHLFRDYRSLRLTICPGFLAYEERGQTEIIIHELVHCFTVPLKTVCFEAMEDLDTDEQLKTIIQRQINSVMEQITQDFAFSISRRIQ
jgi:hypothetical protein